MQAQIACTSDVIRQAATRAHVAAQDVAAGHDVSSHLMLKLEQAQKHSQGVAAAQDMCQSLLSERYETIARLDGLASCLATAQADCLLSRDNASEVAARAHLAEQKCSKVTVELATTQLKLSASQANFWAARASGTDTENAGERGIYYCRRRCCYYFLLLRYDADAQGRLSRM